ncbi:MAG: protein kinase domain-containing protein [Pyrinomonadaceae bacterium]
MKSEPTVTPGQVLSSYRILSTLGRGGMGEVFLAEDSRLGRKVALKLLPSSFTNDAERLARFEREARAASALNHPNILTIYEVGSFDGRQFIAAEFVDGETLRQRQAHTPLKLTEILDLAIQVVSALAAAHQAGIVHRDIKPDNIMLRRDGYAKVVDFGLAKLTQTAKVSADTSLSTMLQVDTGTGVVMGTTAYMSPEQARGLELDARTDIWSLGVVLYEMLSGATPFKGDTASDLIVSILERDPTPLVTTPLVPSELDWIVRRALRKDREERYQTARELLGDLRGLKQQLEFAAQVERSATPDPMPATASRELASSGAQRSDVATVEPRAIPTGQIERTPTGIQPAAASTRRVRTFAIGAGLAVLLIAAGLALYKFWPSRKVTAPFQSMKITRLTNSGRAIDAILSPDGKYIVYSLSDAGKQSLWIRQVSTANDKLIVPPAPVGFFGVTFSRDGNDLYYVIKAMDTGTLYRLPALGGTPVKILQGLDASVSISPDGKQLVLVRTNYPNPGESALIIANIDGTGARNLAIRKPPEYFAPLFFTGPSWSPDGKLVAASVGSHGSPSHVFAFAVADGKATDLTPSPWQFTARVEWLPDMSGLLVVAGEAVGPTQIWFLSYPGGERRRITNDLNGYRSIGLAADGTKFSTIQRSGLVNIWIAPDGDAKRAIQLPTGNIGFFGTSGSSLSWTPEGGIVFVSNETDNLDIWSMDSKGENRLQLTTKAGQNFSPVVSPDGRYVTFTSDRTGTRNIWRMGLDGSDQMPLTNGWADGFATISPDSRWVFYSSVVSGKPTLWRVPIDGGTPVELTNRPANAPIISPDGKFIAYLYPESSEPWAPPNRMAIMPIAGGEPIKTFSFQGPTIVGTSAHWSGDGRAILYTVSNNNVTNIWSQPVEGGTPRQVTDFKDSVMTGFAWSRDGKILGCTRGVLTRDAVLISDVK